MKSFIKILGMAMIAILLFQCKSEKSKIKGAETTVASKSGHVSADGKASLTDDEMEQAKKIYFQTCAGCHGTSRNGATGPSLLPEKRTALLGTAGLKAFITNGTPGGMPDWGKQGILTPEEIDLMARFIQLPPPPIPAWTMEDMKSKWKLHIPVADRPTKPEHNRNWQNYFGVVLRDAGKVAIIDGDTKEKVAIVETGYAVHILRSTASGRYFYSIGRDGKITLIDLWMKTPTVVAEGKASFDARSVEVSKYNGPKGDFKDKYVIVGGYTPSHCVIMDALTLEPLKVVKTSGKELDNGPFLEEARVASIVASHTDPLWVVNVKETGMVMLVDYSDLNKIEENTVRIPTAKFLHDGGWDKTGRYFIVAANASNKLVVVDVKDKKLKTIIDVGTKPHPGRGANIKNAKYGNMWVTGHVGENRLSFIGTDPGPNQFKEVTTIKGSGDGGGNLFVKSHPKSMHLWADRALSNDSILQRTIDVYDISSLKLVKSLVVPAKYHGRAVHMEYNKDGNEVWISVWGKMNKPEENAVLVYDDKTLNLKKEIVGDWVVTPTGKFNVFNTMADIY